MDVKCEIIRDHFQNAKLYNIPRCQVLIADVPYNLGKNFYASNLYPKLRKVIMNFRYSFKLLRNIFIWVSTFLSSP